MKPFNNIAVSPTEPENKADVWIQHSKNLFNPDNIIENGYDSSTGNQTTNTLTYATKNKIKVIPNKKIVFSKNGKIIATRFFFYQKSGTFISSIVQETEPIIIPSNASYINFQVSKTTVDNSLEGLQLEYDNVTTFEKYVNPDILVNNNGSYNSVLTQEIFTGKEFKTNKIIDGKQVYAKYIDLGKLSNTSGIKNINIGISFKNIVNYYVKMTDQASTLFMPIPAVSSDTAIYCYFNENNIVISVSKDRSTFNATLYVEYFKD